MFDFIFLNLIQLKYTFVWGVLLMKLLEEKILKDGKVFPGSILKVDSFLNHQIDTELLAELGKEFARLYKDSGVNKVLTIESSGIAIAAFAAHELRVPLLFAKKSQTKNIAGQVYTSKVMSYTHGKVYDIIVSKEYLNPGDKVLIIDDFLANGAALDGLIDVIKQSGAELVGCGIAIEKAFQEGGKRLRSQGIRIESLAKIASMDDSSLKFE